MFERDFAADEGVGEFRAQDNHRVERAAVRPEAGLGAVAVDANALGAESGDEARVRREVVADLAEERGVLRVVGGLQAADVGRISVGVAGGFVGAGIERAECPTADRTGRGARGLGVETQLLIHDPAGAVEIAEARVGGRGPVVVVAVDRARARAARDRGETHAVPTEIGAVEAGGEGALLVAAGLVAEGRAPVVIEHELVEAIVEIRGDHGGVPAPEQVRIPRKTETRRGLVARIGVAVQRDVVAEAVALGFLEGETHHELLGLGRDERTADGKAAGAKRVAADGALDLAGPERRRRIGDETDHPARSVSAERARLRAAQHFDLVHIERAGDRAEAGEIKIVDEKAHSGVGRLAFVLGVLADAANLKIARTRRSARPGEIGNLVGEIAEVADGTDTERLVVEDRDARRNAHERRLPEIGGDADRLELDRRGIRGRRFRASSQSGSAGEDEKDDWFQITHGGDCPEPHADRRRVKPTTHRALSCLFPSPV